MKRQKITYIVFGLIVSIIFLTAFKEKTKPHLIVGLWKITEENAITLTDKNLFINQLYFGGDELSSNFSYTDKKGKHKEKGLRLAYQTYENIENYKMPLVYFINTCDKDFKLAFTIEKLTKDTLKLKCLQDITSKNILLNREILTFERIGGPPENMSHSEDAIQIEIKIDDDK